jgi:hypothetical protein
VFNRVDAMPYRAAAGRLIEHCEKLLSNGLKS